MSHDSWNWSGVNEINTALERREVQEKKEKNKDKDKNKNKNKTKGRKKKKKEGEERDPPYGLARGGPRIWSLRWVSTHAAFRGKDSP